MFGPRSACRVGEPPKRLWLDLGAVARRLGDQVAAPVEPDRLDEVLVQVVDELARAVLEGAGHRDVVEEGEMLHVLAEAYPAGVWADRHAELRRQQQHSQHLVDPT